MDSPQSKTNDDCMQFMADTRSREEINQIMQNMQSHIDANKVILCTKSNKSDEKSETNSIRQPSLSPILISDDDNNDDENKPNFNELNPPSLQTYDSTAISIVDTIEDGILRELERSNDLSRLIEGESVVFSQLKRKICGSWTQRFVLKRAKIKYLNMLFNQRVSLLHTYTLRDEQNTKKYLSAYHGLAVYTFYHENALKNILEISEKYDKFIHFVKNMAISFVQKAVISNQAQIVINPLFLHSIAKIFALDIDHKNDNKKNQNQNGSGTKNESLIELYKIVRNMRSKLYYDLKRIEHSMKNCQQRIDEKINGMKGILGSTNQNPLVKDEIFNFLSVSKQMKRIYKKLMIPKIYLNKMIIEYIPLFQKLTDFVSSQLKKVSEEWMRQIFESFEFNEDIWNELQIKYERESAQNVEIDLNEHYFVWIGENYAQTNVFLNNELIALDKLLKDHVVTQDIVHILSCKPSSIYVPGELRHLFDGRKATLVEDGLMNAMLCESGSICFYHRHCNENKEASEEGYDEMAFCIYLSSKYDIHYEDDERSLTFLLKPDPISLIFKDREAYQQWKCVYLSHYIK